MYQVVDKVTHLFDDGDQLSYVHRYDTKIEALHKFNKLIKG